MNPQMLEWWEKVVREQLAVAHPALYRSLKRDKTLDRWVRDQAEWALETYRQQISNGVPQDLALEQALEAVTPAEPLPEEQDPVLEYLAQREREAERMSQELAEEMEKSLLAFLKKEGIL